MNTSKYYETSAKVVDVVMAILVAMAILFIWSQWVF